MNKPFNYAKTLPIKSSSETITNWWVFAFLDTKSAQMMWIARDVLQWVVSIECVTHAWVRKNSSINWSSRWMDCKKKYDNTLWMLRWMYCIQVCDTWSIQLIFIVRLLSFVAHLMGFELWLHWILRGHYELCLQRNGWTTIIVSIQTVINFKSFFFRA